MPKVPLALPVSNQSVTVEMPLKGTKDDIFTEKEASIADNQPTHTPHPYPFPTRGKVTKASSVPMRGDLLETSAGDIVWGKTSRQLSNIWHGRMESDVDVSDKEQMEEQTLAGEGNV